MPSSIRILKHSAPHLTGCRTFQEQLLMRPDEAIVEIVGGVIARYQEKHGITIYDLNFLSNHVHIACSGSENKLWRFQMDCQREIAKRINRYLGRHGKFWAKRYASFEIVDAHTDGLEALLYITTNAVHHGLVDHPKNWPGLNAYWQHLGKNDTTFKFTHWTEYHRAKFRARITNEVVRLENFQTKHTLKIAPLPQLQDKSFSEQAEYLNKEIEARVALIRKERKADGRGFLGRKKVLAQNPYSRPRTTKKGCKPPCYTKSPDARSEFIKWWWGIRAWYVEASEKYRSGTTGVEFPPYTFKPSLLFETGPP